MWKISEQDRIILRQLAKKANKEIQDKWAAQDLIGKESSEAAAARNAISKEALARYAKMAAPRFTFVELIYMIGIVNGKIKER